MNFFKNKTSIRQSGSNQSRRFSTRQFVTAVSLLLLSVTAMSYAAGLVTLATFTSGTTISSADVNSNFNKINDALATMSASITSLVSQVGGAVSGTTGNFSGSLNATTGTFSGAVTATNLFGQGQAWNVYPSLTRGLETLYTNNTGRPIQVAVIMQFASGPGGNGASLFVDGYVASTFNITAYSMSFTLAATVMPGSSYYVTDLKTNGGTSSVVAWRELR